MKTVKKALSTLLILSAILGLAGGAKTFKDVMDCKLYWEGRSVEAHENLGLLSDGLSQLRENEAAYLEGRESYEEGQKALEEGQKAYDEGAALLDEKQAEYDAGKKKLEEAERQLAEGKAKLDANRDAYEQGKQDYEEGKARLAMAKQELAAGKKQLDEAKAKLDAGKARLDALTPEQMAQMEDVYNRVEAAGGGEAGVAAVADAATRAKIEENNDAIQEGVTAAVRAVVKEKVETDYGSELDSAMALAQPLIQSEAEQTVRSQVQEEVTARYEESIREQVLASNPDATEEEISFAVTAGLLLNSFSIRSEVNQEMNNRSDEVQAIADERLAQRRDELIETFTDIGMQNQEAQDAITENVASTKQSLYDQNIDGATDQVRQAYEGWQGKLAYDEGIVRYEEGLAKYEEGLAEYQAGEQQLAEGKAKLDEYEAGLAAYNAGLAEYNAGKKKLEEGAVQLADGKKKLDDAKQQLADGEQQLENGARQLAQFEDGRDQVLAGLDMLLDTRADADLVSISGRLGADFSVTEGETGLDIGKGMDAVDAGLAYVDDTGVAVAQELTKRMYGAALALAGGLFAALAGILGLCKKNKASGILAVLAAVSAWAGLMTTMSTDNAFSRIAGGAGSPVLVIGCTAVIVLGAIQAVLSVRTMMVQKAAKA